MRADGIDARVLDFGVGGDTAGQGLLRVDAVLASRPDVVVVAFGTNDALQTRLPDFVRGDLDRIVSRLDAAGAEIVLAGTYPIWPTDDRTGYGTLGAQESFAAIFPDLARAYGAVLYPRFLDGVLADPALAWGDGIHANAAGTAAIAARIVPFVAEAIARLEPAGADTLDGGPGDDRLFGSLGDDLGAGGAGNDLVSGDGGNDVLSGDAGDDLLNGGAGADVLAGGPDADRLVGGPGPDILIGGPGADTFVYAAGDGADLIADFGPGDRLDLVAFDIRTVPQLVAEARPLVTGNGLVLDFGNGDTLTLIGAGALTADALV